MGALRELYQEVILDHNRSPRNYRVIPGADRVVDGYNPLCGDRYTIYLRMDGDRIREVAFQGAGCAISKASASLMSVALEGKTREEAEHLFEVFHLLVTGKLDPDRHADELGSLAVFAGVSEFPARVKCAILAWHTVKAALAGSGGAVTSE